MELFSAQFLLFLSAAWCVYMALGRVAPAYQWTALLGASLVFYGVAGGWQSMAFVVLAALVTWGAALGLEKLEARCKEERKATADRAEKKERAQGYP